MTACLCLLSVHVSGARLCSHATGQRERRERPTRHERERTVSVSQAANYNRKRLCVCSYRVFCLLGDGELSEGSVWEAMAFASYYQLDNLVAILDINRLGQSDPAPLQHHVEKHQRRCEAFG